MKVKDLIFNTPGFSDFFFTLKFCRHKYLQVISHQKYICESLVSEKSAHFSLQPKTACSAAHCASYQFT